MNLQTKGVSPKLIADFVVSVLTYILARYGIQLDATESALIAKGVGAVAAYMAPHGVTDGNDPLHPLLADTPVTTVPVPPDGIDAAQAPA